MRPSAVRGSASTVALLAAALLGSPLPAQVAPAPAATPEATTQPVPEIAPASAPTTSVMAPTGLTAAQRSAALSRASETEQLSVPFSATLPSTDAGLFTVHPFVFRPHLSYRYSSGDGVLSRPGESSETSINSYSPGLLIELGPVWTLDYTPTFTYYSNDRFEDATNHAVRLDGRTSYQNWAFDFGHRFESYSRPLVETGTQTDVDRFDTQLGVAYALGSKILLDGEIRNTLRYSDSFTDYREWRFPVWVRYQYVPGLSFGVGGSYGTIDMDAGPDVQSQAIQVRVDWQVASKLDLHLEAGRDYRQFDGDLREDESDPVYSGSLEYRPLEYTSITLSASRNIRASFFNSQIIERENIGVSLQQRLLGFLFLRVGLSRIDSNYQSAVSNAAASREDERDTVSVQLSTAFLRRGAISVFYVESDNDSSSPDFEFGTDQAGVQVEYAW